MNLKSCSLAGLIILYCCLISSIAHANAIIPFVTFQYPALVLTLLPVVLIEATWLKKTLNWSWSKSLGSALGANLISTLAGLVLAVVLFIADFSALAFIVMPNGEGRGLSGILYFGLQLVWLGCFWALSTWTEYLYLKARNKRLSPNLLKKASLYANLLSYGCILIVVVSYFIWSAL